MSSRAELIVKRQREISFRSKNSASWNPAFKGGFPLGEIFRPNRNFSLFHELSSRTNYKKTKRNFVSVEKFRLVESGLKGGFPLGEIFRPNRNFSLFHELSSRTNCKKTKRNFVSVEKFRLVELGLKAVFH